MLAFLSEFLWVAYSLWSRQWGFLLLAVPFGAVNLRNYLKWAPV
jgi:hypothetical protein